MLFCTTLFPCVGLETVRKLPSELQWELGIQPLIEWYATTLVLVHVAVA